MKMNHLNSHETRLSFCQVATSTSTDVSGLWHILRNTHVFEQAENSIYLYLGVPQLQLLVLHSPHNTRSILTIRLLAPGVMVS
jgi:hypothetical protein